MDTIDNTEDLINTTHRYNHYCNVVSDKGDKCCLYAPHESVKHKADHSRGGYEFEG